MVSHPYMLSRNNEETDANWLARQRAELLEAEATILKETGQSHRFLAYPYGEFNAQIKAMLVEEGYVGFAQNSGAVGYNSDFHALPRYPLAGIYARLETARVKFNSLAFNVELLEPDSPVTELERPEALLKFNLSGINSSQLGCYDNGQAMTLTWETEKRVCCGYRPLMHTVIDDGATYVPPPRRRTTDTSGIPCPGLNPGRPVRAGQSRSSSFCTIRFCTSST